MGYIDTEPDGWIAVVELTGEVAQTAIALLARHPLQSEHRPPPEGWSPIGERTSVFLTSSVTARRFYERNGYARSGEPKSVYGLRSAYPMSKRIA